MTSPLLATWSETEAVERPLPPAPHGETRRVLVVVRWPVGGIRTHLVYNLPAAAAAGYRFTFVGPADAPFDDLRDALRDLEGAEFIGVPVRGPRCRLWPAVRRLLRQGRFDLVHSHGLTAAVHAVVAGFGVGTPHATTLHEPFRNGQFPGLLGRLKRWALGRLLGRADAVVAVGEAARANYLEHLPALRRVPGRIVPIANGIRIPGDPGERDSDPDALRRRLGCGPKPALVGFLGRFMPEKGFPLLLEAVERLAASDATPPFHIAAFGAGDYRMEYRREVERRGLAGRITLLDFVPDVWPVLRQLDLVVVPSLWEASPLLPMEALAAGVPVIGSDCPGLREVLRGSPSRLFPVGDADALSRELLAALSAPWTAAARAFAPLARARFDNSRSARRLVELYDRLARAGA